MVEDEDTLKVTAMNTNAIKTMTREADETLGMSPGYEMNTSTETEIEEKPVSYIQRFAAQSANSGSYSQRHEMVQRMVGNNLFGRPNLKPPKKKIQTSSTNLTPPQKKIPTPEPMELPSAETTHTLKNHVEFAPQVQEEVL